MIMIIIKKKSSRRKKRINKYCGKTLWFILPQKVCSLRFRCSSLQIL